MEEEKNVALTVRDSLETIDSVLTVNGSFETIDSAFTARDLETIEIGTIHSAACISIYKLLQLPQILEILFKVYSKIE